MTLSYGYELILDLHHCKVSTFNRESISSYFETLCKAIDMQRCDVYWWDDPEGRDERCKLLHTQGVSAVQFIVTSSIVVHALELLESAYINIFSCKDFDPTVAERITTEWFEAGNVLARFIERT